MRIGRIKSMEIAWVLISFIMLTASIAIHEINIILFIGFVPFFILIHDKSWKRVCLFSYIVGVMVLSVILFGVAMFSMSIYILFSLFFASYFVLYATTFYLIEKRLNVAYLPVLMPVIWVLIELYLTEGPASIPFNVGLFQYNHPWVIQIADVLGIYGVSFLVMLFNICIFYFWMCFKDKRFRFRHLFVPFTVIVLIFIYNTYRLNALVNQSVQFKKAAILQGDLSYEETALRYKTRAYHIKSRERYNDLIRQIKPGSVDLVLLPESGIMGYVLNIPRLFNQYSTLSKQLDSVLMFQVKEKDKKQLFNTLLAFSPTGEFLGFSRKYKPIHFAEAGFTGNKAFIPILTNFGYVGAQICFDICFPSISRKLVQRGAEVLVVSSNDNRFGYSHIPLLHAQFLPFRAIETRKFVISANNSGISSGVNPRGEILYSSRLFNTELLYIDFSVNRTKTIFLYLGLWSIVILLMSYSSIGIGLNVLTKKY